MPRFSGPLRKIRLAASRSRLDVTKVTMASFAVVEHFDVIKHAGGGFPDLGETQKRRDAAIDEH